MILVMQVPDEVLDKIPDIEQQKAHFQLLTQVNALMVKEFLTRFFAFYKNKRIEC